jgi:hypothetical protein
MATSRSTTAVQIGARVVSADGKQLGVVKQARGDRFLVDARWALDYWLGTEAIDNASDDLVQLIITRDGIGPAKLHNEVKGPGIDNDAESFGGPAPANRPPPAF